MLHVLSSFLDSSSINDEDELPDDDTLIDCLEALFFGRPGIILRIRRLMLDWAIDVVIISVLGLSLVLGSRLDEIFNFSV